MCFLAILSVCVSALSAVCADLCCELTQDECDAWYYYYEGLLPCEYVGGDCTCRDLNGECMAWDNEPPEIHDGGDGGGDEYDWCTDILVANCTDGGDDYCKVENGQCVTNWEYLCAELDYDWCSDSGGYCTWEDGYCVPSVPVPGPDDGGCKGSGCDGNGTDRGNGTNVTNCGTITNSNVYECCEDPSNADKCWTFYCGTLSDALYPSCCSGSYAMNGGCSGYCSTIKNSTHYDACCKNVITAGGKAAAGCLSYRCSSTISTSSDYADCCEGAVVAGGCATADYCSSASNRCPSATCTTITTDNYLTCCSVSTRSGCVAFSCSTVSTTADYIKCCGGIAEGRGCGSYCSGTSRPSECPVDPCAEITKNNCDACGETCPGSSSKKYYIPTAVLIVLLLTLGFF